MTPLKALAFAIAFILGAPVDSFANDDPVITDEAIKAASELEISRDVAIKLSTDLAECAGFFEAFALYSREESSMMTQSKTLTNTFHTAAILIWSKHGTNFLQIKSIKNRHADAVRATLDAAYNLDSAESHTVLRENMSECQQLAKLAGAVSNYARDPAETEWR